MLPVTSGKDFLHPYQATVIIAFFRVLQVAASLDKTNQMKG